MVSANIEETTNLLRSIQSCEIYLHDINRMFGAEGLLQLYVVSFESKCSVHQN